MKIEIRRSAINDLQQIESKSRKRIHNAIQKLEYFPDVANIKKLTDFEPAYRLRVGAYRILFDLQDNTIIIARIILRKDSFKKKK